jgi:integrase
LISTNPTSQSPPASLRQQFPPALKRKKLLESGFENEAGNEKKAGRGGWIESARDSAKWYTRHDMAGEQASLFDRKKYKGVMPQTYQIEPPAAGHSVLKTLLAYNTYLRSGGYSKYTPDDFTSDVKKFGLFVKEKKLKDIKLVDIQQWIGEIKKVMKEKTVSRKISAVTNYFNWLAQEKVLTENPAQAIRYIRVTSPLPDILFDEECQKLLAAASADPRSYLLVLLLLDTGMKKEELFDLKITHFDFSNKYAPELWLKHAGKKVKKDRKLKLPHEVVPVFQEYVKRYGITDLLFPYSCFTNLSSN